MLALVVSTSGAKEADGGGREEREGEEARGSPFEFGSVNVDEY